MHQWIETPNPLPHPTPPSGQGGGFDIVLSQIVVNNPTPLGNTCV